MIKPKYAILFSLNVAFWASVGRKTFSLVLYSCEVCHMADLHPSSHQKCLYAFARDIDTDSSIRVWACVSCFVFDLDKAES